MSTLFPFSFDILYNRFVGSCHAVPGLGRFWTRLVTIGVALHYTLFLDCRCHYYLEVAHIGR